MNNSKYFLHIIGWILLLYSIPLNATSILSDNIEVDQHSSLKQKVDDYHKRGRNHASSQIDSATFYLNKAHNIARNINYSLGKAKIYNTRAYMAMQSGEVNKAIDYIDIAENLEKEDPDPLVRASIIYHRAISYRYQNQYKKATKSALEAKKIFEKENDTRGIIQSYSLISQIHSLQGNDEKAFKYAQKCLNLSRTINDQKLLAASLSNISIYLLQRNQKEKAKQYIQEAIQINSKHNINRMWLANNYQMMAKYYYQNLQPDSSYLFNKKAEVIYHEMNSKIGLVQTWNSLASNALDQGKFNEAKALLQRSYHLAISDNIISSVPFCLKSLYTISLHEKNYKDACFHLSEYTKVNDSLNQEKNNNSLNVLEMQLAFDKEKADMEIERQNIIIKNQRKTFYISLLVGVISFLIVLVLLILRIHKGKNKRTIIEKKQLSEELDMKQKELVLSTMKTVKREESIRHLIHEMQSFSHDLQEKNQQKLKQVIVQLGKIQEEAYWEEFEYSFRNIHREFLDTLRKSYPEISPAEIKVCAFIKLNMSTKEIARVLHKSPASIEVDRTRIRKKFGLTNKNISLQSFIDQL